MPGDLDWLAAKEITLHFQKSSARFASVSASDLSVPQEGNQ
jgi:hypothetical protein